MSEHADLSFLESHSDVLESLPAEVRRMLLHIKEQDRLIQDVLCQVRLDLDEYSQRVDEASPSTPLSDTDRTKKATEICRQLSVPVERTHEKFALASQIYDLVDRHIRKLDDDISKLEDSQMIGPAIKLGGEARTPTSEEKAKPSEKKKRKQGPSEEPTSPPRSRSKPSQPAPKDFKVNPLEGLEINPDEPKYCICRQVSYGIMLGCDNDDCPYEWFHMGCLNLKEPPPKGQKWYCEHCANARRKDTK
ncbi:uncharacterized protein BJ171DRAFT_522784 [Polychytrium aggregatum]|uniref:uncharacterized protein n=1 Tax=Polychytrium aggregatum TaxID=110093 RepID=UPI0022FF02E5|nr:uncharacterized protein BJ171DRAFT_522784 [Polychytrium aggregatum]KAI9197128.1 hypothetical protein BJ171DRAFT_522784 [Polychytrium aggregatum]